MCDWSPVQSDFKSSSLDVIEQFLNQEIIDRNRAYFTTYTFILSLNWSYPLLGAVKFVLRLCPRVFCPNCA